MSWPSLPLGAVLWLHEHLPLRPEGSRVPSGLDPRTETHSFSSQERGLEIHVLVWRGKVRHGHLRPYGSSQEPLCLWTFEELMSVPAATSWLDAMNRLEECRGG